MVNSKHLGLLLAFGILSTGCIPDLKKKASFQFSLTARGGSGSQSSSSGDAGSGDLGSTDSGTGRLTVFQKFAQVMNTRCLTCHQPGGSLGWFSGAQIPIESQWLTMAYQRSRIKPGKAGESSLYQLIVTGVVASRMPKGLPPLPSQEAENVAAWINSLPEDGGSEMGEPETPQGPPSEFVTRVMDRKGLYRWFLARFGSTIDADAKSNILSRPARFGGSCEVNHSTYIQPEDYCESVPSKDGLILTAPAIPDADIGREGYRTQLCRKVLFSNDSGQPYSSRIHNALRSLDDYRGLSSRQIHAHLAQQPVPTRAQISRMYEVFSGGRQASFELLNRLEALAGSAQAPGIQVVSPSTDRRQESWRYVLLSMCYATDQQFL